LQWLGEDGDRTPERIGPALGQQFPGGRLAGSGEVVVTARGLTGNLGVDVLPAPADPPRVFESVEDPVGRGTRDSGGLLYLPAVERPLVLEGEQEQLQHIEERSAYSDRLCHTTRVSRYFKSVNGSEGPISQ